jgi:hypothetical protein
MNDLLSAIRAKLEDFAGYFVYVFKTCETLDADGRNILQLDTAE